jgi:hypothetical protein
LVLIPKQLREGPEQRTWAEFLLDLSKQLVGAGWLLVLSWLCGGIMQDSDAEVDKCTQYWATISLDATVGVFVEYLLLNALSPLLEKATGHKGDFLSGEYIDDDDELVAGKYMKQLAVWVGCVTGAKLFMISLSGFVGLGWLSIVRTFLKCVSWNAKVESVFVMVVSPVCMLAFQFWVTDNFIKYGGVTFANCWQKNRGPIDKAHARPPRLAQIGETNRVDTHDYDKTYGLREPFLPSDDGASDCESGDHHYGEAHINSSDSHIESPGESPERYGNGGGVEECHGGDSPVDERVENLEHQLSAERRERNRFLVAERQALQQQLAEERFVADQLIEKEQRGAEEARKHERELLDLAEALRKHHELASEDAAERQRLRDQVAELTEHRQALEAETAQTQACLSQSRNSESQLRAKVARLTETFTPPRSDPPSSVHAVSPSATSPEGSGCHVLAARDGTPLRRGDDDIVGMTHRDNERLSPEQFANFQRGAALDRKLGALEAKMQGLVQPGSVSGNSPRLLAGALEAKIHGLSRPGSAAAYSPGPYSAGFSCASPPPATNGHSQHHHSGPAELPTDDPWAVSPAHPARGNGASQLPARPYFDIGNVENSPPKACPRGLQGLEDLLRIQRHS